VHALGAPLDAFWRVDVAPLSITELHAHDGRWTLTRTNAPGDRGEAPRGDLGAAAAGDRGAGAAA
jgi:hypothetical protein